MKMVYPFPPAPITTIIIIIVIIVLLLYVLRGQMLSTAILIYSMDVWSRLIIV